MTIEEKFDKFVLALQPLDSNKYFSELTGVRWFSVKLTSQNISNWCSVSKQELRELTIPDLVVKYTEIKHEKEREYGM